MAILKDFDLSKPFSITGVAYDLDFASTLRPVECCARIIVKENDLKVLMKWVTESKRWQSVFEEFLQCVAETNEGEPLLSTWIPLVDFRYRLCSENLNASEETLKVLQKLFVQTRSWRDMGVDTVGIDGFRK